MNMALDLETYYPHPFASVEDERAVLCLLCPVQALRLYIMVTQSFRRSEQLLVRYGRKAKE